MSLFSRTSSGGDNDGWWWAPRIIAALLIGFIFGALTSGLACAAMYH